MTQPPEPPDDAWPTSDEPTVISQRETAVGAPPPVGPPPDRRIGAGMLLGLGAVALVAIGILLAYLLTHRHKEHPVTTTVVTTAPSTSTTATSVAVPRLVGLKEQDALLRLGQVGLRPKEVFKPTSKPTGLVVSQAPKEASEIAKGSQVTLVVDSGAAKVAVPDLTGQSFADAQAKLDAAGLASAKTEVTSDQPAGTVVDQAPPAGSKLAKGSQVTLSVAQGQATTTNATTTAATTAPATTAKSTTTTTTTAPPQPQNATMPDVSGQNEASAVQAMGKVGILVSLVFVPGKDPLGMVEQQAKPAGTTVPFHSHVQINLSKGPNNTANAQVPNVLGQTLQRAVSAVNGAHLRLIYLKFPVTSKAQAGKVVQQSPLGGGQAPQNAQMLVYLGAYRIG